MALIGAANAYYNALLSILGRSAASSKCAKNWDQAAQQNGWVMAASNYRNLVNACAPIRLDDSPGGESEAATPAAVVAPQFTNAENGTKAHIKKFQAALIYRRNIAMPCI